MENPETPDPLSPALGDWRLNKTGWATAADGVPFDEPKAFHQRSVYTPPGTNNSFSFTTPSAVALHLNGAWKAAKRARIIKDRMHIDIHTNDTGVVDMSVPDEATADLYDYFEEMMVVAMGCGNAIEAFCNQIIIERAAGPIMVRVAKKEGPKQPEEVERLATIDEKLKRIVPDLLGLSTPCNKPAWDAYQRIKVLRDRVTHFKRSDQARSFQQRTQATALLELWMVDCFALPEDAMAVLRYFQPEGQLMRWMLNPMWSRPQGVDKAPG